MLVMDQESKMTMTMDQDVMELMIVIPMQAIINSSSNNNSNRQLGPHWLNLNRHMD